MSGSFLLTSHTDALVLPLVLHSSGLSLCHQIRALLRPSHSNMYLTHCARLAGDVSAGKSSLLKKFKERVTAKGVDQSRTQEYILDYSFCAVKNVLEDEYEGTGCFQVLCHCM